MKKVLIIEDDQIFANIYGNKLRVEGFQVEGAYTGEAGLDPLRGFLPDAVILDLVLPKISGVELMKIVRAEPPFQQLPLIVFSPICSSSSSPAGRPCDCGSAARRAGTARRRSANLIGEIPGRSLKDEVVLLGAHLDSWDLGAGAHDDATGVGIVAAAARLIGESKQRPKRSIRVVFFANEEFGLSGANAYAAAYRDAVDRHVLGLECDLGAFQPYGISARVAPDRLPLVRAVQSVVEPLGIAYQGAEATGGADLGRLRELGVPVMDPAHGRGAVLRPAPHGKRHLRQGRPGAGAPQRSGLRRNRVPRR